MRTEVYSWRVEPGLKSELEREARRRKKALSSILDEAAREWLKKSGTDASDEETQRSLHAAAQVCLGAIEGHDPRRAETARQAIRERLARRHGR